MMQTCKFSHLEFGDPVPYQELSGESSGTSGYQTYLDDCTATLLKVANQPAAHHFVPLGHSLLDHGFLS